jgi:PPOX class probable F420-dependent enzyme
VRVTNLPKALRDFIETGPLAHLATVNANGSPQVTVIWIGLDGDDIVSGHMQMYQKTRNIQREPRVVLSFAAPRTPGVFFAEHAILYATATVEEGGARDLVTRLGKRYVGPFAPYGKPRLEPAGERAAEASQARDAVLGLLAAQLETGGDSGTTLSAKR